MSDKQQAPAYDPACDSLHQVQGNADVQNVGDRYNEQPEEDSDLAIWEPYIYGSDIEGLQMVMPAEDWANEEDEETRKRLGLDGSSPFDKRAFIGRNQLVFTYRRVMRYRARTGDTRDQSVEVMYSSEGDLLPEASLNEMWAKDVAELEALGNEVIEG